MTPPPLRRLRWAHALRIIPSRYPPIQLFERLGGPEDWDALEAIESLTNDRIREALGAISVMPDADRVRGPGAGWVMASFVHLGRPSRFSDGSYGVYYAARERRTAIAETCFHAGRFYRATRESTLDVDMRVLDSAVDAPFHDLRRGQRTWPEVYARDDYGGSQPFGRGLRDQGSNGVVYDSVRHRGGQCLAAFRPRAVGLPREAGHLTYHWNGARIDRVFDHATAVWITRTDEDERDDQNGRSALST